MSGFAYQDKPGPETYAPEPDGGEHKPLRGVSVTDMPMGKPAMRPRPKIKGVSDVSQPHPDYLPGEGEWKPAI